MSRVRLRAHTLHVEMGPTGEPSVEVTYVIMNEAADIVIGSGILKGVEDPGTLIALQELFPGLDEHINRVAGLGDTTSERAL